MSRPIVYLIAQPTVASTGRVLDLSALSEHGEVLVIVRSGDAPSFHPPRTLERIKKRLLRFRPDKDFLVWAGGDTLAALLTGVVLTGMQLKEVQWLRWERRLDPGTGRRVDDGGRYLPVRVTLDPFTFPTDESDDEDQEDTLPLSSGGTSA